MKNRSLLFAAVSLTLLCACGNGNGSENAGPQVAAEVDGAAATLAPDGRPFIATEVASAMEMPLPEYLRLMEDAARGQVLSLESHIDDHGEPNTARTGGPSPEQHLERSEFRQQLVKSIGQLPEREQLVLSMYYEQELNLKEIGAVLGVSESRVCQIHGQAMVRLRGRLQVFEKADAGLEDNE